MPPSISFCPSVQMLAAAERARKQAETERDELSEELASNSSGKWVSCIINFYVFNVSDVNDT